MAAYLKCVDSQNCSYYKRPALCSLYCSFPITDPAFFPSMSFQWCAFLLPASDTLSAILSAFPPRRDIQFRSYQSLNNNCHRPNNCKRGPYVLQLPHSPGFLSRRHSRPLSPSAGGDKPHARGSNELPAALRRRARSRPLRIIHP